MELKVSVRWCIACLAMLVFSGCSVAQKDFALVSNIDNPVSSTPRKDSAYIRGEECSFTLFLFWETNKQNLSPHGAVKNAVEKANQLGYPANALTNVKIRWYGTQYFANFLARWCYSAEGYPANVEAY